MKHIVLALVNASVLRKIVVLCLVMTLVFSLVFPRPVNGQLFLAQLVNLLTSIYEIIRNDLGNVLDQISELTGWFNDYYQLTLFPREAIEAVREFVRWMSGYFQSLINQALRSSTISSRLPATRPLEALVRNGSLDFNRLSEAYRNVYGNLPPAPDASPLDRSLIDIDDALALNSLKTLGIHEATFNVTLGAASEIEAKIADPESAPGAGSFLSAAGTLATLQTQAMIQSMLAAQLRQEAALLAHRNTLLKRDILLASGIRGHINDLLRQK